jgi:hypothetical protein
MVTHICNSSTWETEAGGLQFEGQPGVDRKFQASLNCRVRPCLKKKKKKKNEQPLL